MTSVSVLVAIGVSEDGYREILGASEGASESKECWRNFLVSLRERGLKGVRLFTSDKHLGFLESASEVFPDAKWQRCTVHFFRTSHMNTGVAGNVYFLSQIPLRG